MAARRDAHQHQAHEREAHIDNPQKVADEGGEPADSAQDVYLSPGDAGRFFACAVEATLERKFNIVYATSRPKTAKYDLDTTKRLLGWEPSESWPQGIEVVIGK